MRVGTEEESLESRPFSRFPLLYVASAQIVAGVNLVVAQLEVLVLAVVFPPGTVETGSVGEMTTKRIELYRHVGDGAETVVSRHVSQIEEQIGLYAHQLAAIIAFRLFLFYLFYFFYF